MTCSFIKHVNGTFSGNVWRAMWLDRLTASSALAHNWIVNRAENDNAIEHQRLKRFLAQRKWRALLLAIRSSNVFRMGLMGARLKRMGQEQQQNANNPAPKVDPPTVNLDYRKLMVAPGDSISITAHIVSIAPQCSWTKDGTLLQSDNSKISVTDSDSQSILVISKFTPSDEGSYTIKCQNVAGASTSTIQLITLAPTD
eukprot:sb/3470747/